MCEKRKEEYQNQGHDYLAGLTFIIALLAAFLLTSGCIDIPTVGSLGSMGSPAYTLDESMLTTPVLFENQPPISETVPVQNTPMEPAYSVNVRYETTGFVNGSSTVLRMWVKNTGKAPIFVYKAGTSLDKENWYNIDTRELIEPNSEKLVGLMGLEVPDSNAFTMRMGIAFLVQTSGGNWHDFGTTFFDDQTLSTEPKLEFGSPEYVYNPPGMFEKVNDRITPRDSAIRKVAAQVAIEHPGQYNIYQIIEIFDYVTSSVQYVSDPRGADYWSYPNETMDIGAGDCDDYSTLISSLIEAIGGSTRIYLTDDHAFAAVYVGTETSEISKAISKYYGSVPVRYMEDASGSWLMLDPTSGMYVGDIPGGAISTGNKWGFVNTSRVVVIDIATNG